MSMLIRAQGEKLSRKVELGKARTARMDRIYRHIHVGDLQQQGSQSVIAPIYSQKKITIP